MAEHWIVIGGGFRGIVSSLLLASRGRKVTLIEGGKAIGGVMRSVEMDGFIFDKGCHLFSNDSDATTDILLDILEDDYEPVQVRYASVFNRVKTDGFAIPDLRSFGEENTRDILGELVRAAAVAQRPPRGRTLEEVIVERFGPTAGGLMARAAEKLYRKPLSELDGGGLALSPFRRILFIEDEAALVLKESARLDERVAASSQDDPMKFYRETGSRQPFRNFYPKHRGLMKFCENAEQKLRAKGVEVCCGTPISGIEFGNDCRVSLENGGKLSGDRVLWAAEIDKLPPMLGFASRIDEFIHHVPMVLYYFIISSGTEGPYTYIQNFDLDDLLFRASIPSNYVESAPCPPGKSYVCCEVPTQIGSSVWEDKAAHAAQVWDEVQRYGVAGPGGYQDVKSIAVPKTYKMPKTGYWDELKGIAEAAAAEPRLVGACDWEVSKNDIIRTVLRHVT